METKNKMTNKKQPKEITGISIARQMKKEGYDDSEIVQETGYHI